LKVHKQKLVRAWRLACAFHYLLVILIIVPIIFHPIARKAPKRRQFASLLYRRFYNALNIKLIIEGTPTQETALWVCNHISWLDILLLAGNNTVDFIAKTEVGDWPLIGYIVKRAGTLLIERDNKFQAYRALPKLQERIKKGVPVLIFPEGTTSNGSTTLAFKPMFYQAAVRENILIQPISLQYFDMSGKITESVAFINDDDISTSLKRILDQPKITAIIQFLPVVSAANHHRKQLATMNRQSIVKSQVPHSFMNTHTNPHNSALQLSKIQG
jgi:1-acyl-sn-glycerol-3-phosphate acyltransferase